MTANLHALLRLEPVRDAVEALRRADAVARLHARDAGLFSDAPDVRAAVAERLGWLDVTRPNPEWASRIAAFADAARADGFARVVLAGMGGSSLAPEVFAQVFRGRVTGAEVQVLDSTHPVAVRRVLDTSDLASTLVVVSSKSGSTEETRAFGAHAARLVPSPQHLAAITDPGSALAEEARAGSYRDVFLNPPDIGGRYSALSLVGMVPAGLAGVDPSAVWERSAAMAQRCGPGSDLGANPAVQLAAFMGGLALAGRDKLTVLAPAALEPLGDWIEQLVAESTGKQGLGIVPVVGEPAGPPDAYGDDRAFVLLRLAGEEPSGTDGLAEAGHPVLTLDLADRYDVGGEFLRWEAATALAGVILGVNPFDEPNVSESKANTRAVLAEVEAGGTLPEPEDGDVERLVASLRPGDYLSVQAYLPPSADAAAAIGRLRRLVRDRVGVATTAGWGPRFLHSTGQLHKGGPDTVVGLQLVDAPTGGPDIPGRPYDFATLVRAQAVGDLRSLRDHDRRVAQVGVAGEDGLDRLVARVDAATP